MVVDERKYRHSVNYEYIRNNKCKKETIARICFIWKNGWLGITILFSSEAKGELRYRFN
jgi:hypothetical protein